MLRFTRSNIVNVLVYGSLLSTPAWADDMDRYIPAPGPDGRIPVVTDEYDSPKTKIVITKPENRERLIRQWAASGEICRALDRHFWIMIPHTTLEYRADGAYPKHRKCELCGKTETKEEVWR